MDLLDASPEDRRKPRVACRRLAREGTTLALALLLGACAVGPDYRRPAVEIPQSFKEGVSWQRAQANPEASISSTWWRQYRDNTLDGLVERALDANQSIVAAEAAYRVALATVQVNTAALFPIVTAGASGARTGTATGVTQAGAGTSSIGRSSQR